MRRLLPSLILALAGSLGATTGATAQGADDEARVARQVEALRAFAMLDGAWRGTATVTADNGSRISFIQTERIGPFLGGAVRVIEGRGYADDGRTRFNAFGTISYDVDRRAYSLHSYAQGRVGDFPFRPTADGYAWEIAYGPTTTVRYVASVRDGELHEVGDLHVQGKPPQRVFEMRLQRVGDTDWPSGGAVPPR